MSIDSLRLDDIAQVLGCSKPTASLLRNGKYEHRPSSDLPLRYQALVRVLTQTSQAQTDQRSPADALCLACPRQDCTGCRIAEINH